MTEMRLGAATAGAVSVQRSASDLRVTVRGRLDPEGLQRLAELLDLACDGTVHRLELALDDLDAVRHVAAVRAALAAVPPGVRRPAAIELTVPRSRTGETD